MLGFPSFENVSAIMSRDFSGEEGTDAAWFASNDVPSGINDVEDSAAGFAATSDGIGLYFRFAWASHQEVDVTRIAIHGTQASASLTTTFGMSPNRLTSPSLLIDQQGRRRQCKL
jgi:oxidoreductase